MEKEFKFDKKEYEYTKDEIEWAKKFIKLYWEYKIDLNEDDDEFYKKYDLIDNDEVFGMYQEFGRFETFMSGFGKRCMFEKYLETDEEAMQHDSSRWLDGHQQSLKEMYRDKNGFMKHRIKEFILAFKYLMEEMITEN